MMRFFRRFLWIVISGLLVTVVFGSYLYRIFPMAAEQRLERVKRNLNDLYRTYRPFPYRWSDAPYSAHEPKVIPKTLLGRTITEIQSVEAAHGHNAQTLQLLGRVYLLAGDYDEAVQSYHAAMIWNPEDSNLVLELSISFALRAKKEDRALDYERALETILRIKHSSQKPEIIFDTALLFEDVPLPYQALERWQTAIEEEPWNDWREEAEKRLSDLTRCLQAREESIQTLTVSSTSYLAHADRPKGSLELVLEAATANWLPVADTSLIDLQALWHLAQEIETEHKDRWLLDLLASSHNSAPALRALSESWKANSLGYHLQAEHFAVLAESLFRRAGNLAGVLRARLEQVYALDRRQHTPECMKALNSLRSSAHARHYVWIEGQSWLEEISCRTEKRTTEVIAIRERAYEWIARTGYEVLRLRALSFMTEDYVSFGSRLSIWQRGRAGLESFWKEALPAGRGYTFYYTMASSAREAGDQEAALALLQEGVHLLKNSPHRQLLALVLSHLAAWQSEIGLTNEAGRTFEQMESLFAQSERSEMEALWHEAEIMHAESDTAAGQPETALLRLRCLTRGKQYPFLSFSPVERRRLLPAFGNAYLARGKLITASRYYSLVISEVRKGLKSVQDAVQRENAQREVEAAWKGLTEISLRLHRILLACKTWEDYRAGELDNRQALTLPPSGTTVLVYAFLSHGLSAWLIQRNGVEQTWLDPKEAKNRAIRFSNLVADPSSNLADVQDAGRNLYAMLFQPFQSHLAAQRIIIIDADGPLAGVPWSALVDERGQFLVRRFAIAQATGWSRIAARISGTWVDLSKPLLFADPALGAELVDQYGPLPDARREARHVQQLLPASVFVSGKAATFEALAHLGSRSTVLHFGGHGVSYGGFGALLLAPSDGDTVAARVVAADEIGELNLGRLQLVVLAACSSGAGEQLGIVNLDSLVQGFFRAGASRVVAARWNVSSPETVQMMEKFYDLLVQRECPSEALRRAMLALYMNPSRSHPYYWAGFQVFGMP